MSERSSINIEWKIYEDKEFKTCLEFISKTGYISPFNDIHHNKFLVDSGTIITVNNQLKWGHWEEVQLILSVKWVRTEILESVQNLQGKKAENT